MVPFYQCQKTFYVPKIFKSKKMEFEGGPFFNQYTIYANFVYYYYFHKTNISYLNNAKITQDSENIIKYFEIIFQINQISSFGCTGKTIF